MALTAKVSSTELTGIVESRYVDSVFEVALLNAPGVSYDPANDQAADATFLSTYEVAAGVGGYSRQTIGYTSADVSLYTDDGVALGEKAAVFEHDGSGDGITFTHVALIWGTGNPLTFNTPSAAPTTEIESGAFGILYNNLATTTSGSGQGLEVALMVTSPGTDVSDYAITVDHSGYGYSAGDTITVAGSTLAAAGITNTGTEDLVFTVATIANSTNSGSILSVAKTANTVVLTGGNQAAFYYNLKQFGYYQV